MTASPPSGRRASRSPPGTPGAFLVRVRYSRYWTVTAGEACVERHGDWTEVEVPRPGTVSVAARFSLDGLLGRDRQCSA